jgi:hypothetical protein
LVVGRVAAAVMVAGLASGCVYLFRPPAPLPSPVTVMSELSVGATTDVIAAHPVRRELARLIVRCEDVRVVLERSARVPEPGPAARFMLTAAFVVAFLSGASCDDCDDGEEGWLRSTRRRRRARLRPRDEVELAAVERMYLIEARAEAIDAFLSAAPDPASWSDHEAARYGELRARLAEECAPPPFRPPGHFPATR